ncbi:hypothetical protein OPIT5_11165 [Opitutaceae bacterium TAV5]|nr:hypothetical protein OPIT5_11165 [Opitutaceae bacterium TAV5]
MSVCLSRIATVLAMLLLLPPHLHSRPAPSPSADDLAREQAAQLDFTRALRTLRAAGHPDEAGRPSGDTTGPDNEAPLRRQLAVAAALLGAQPRTASHIGEALAIARAVSSASPSASGPLCIAARYLEARILQSHLEPPDPAGARALYADLLATAPEAPLAQHGGVWLITSLLFQPLPAPTAAASATPSISREARLAEAEAVLPLLTLPAAERDARYLIGRARLRWRLDPLAARHHLERAAAIGFSQVQRQNSLLVTVGELASETGDAALAIRCYETFLQSASRDTRAFTLRQRLAALKQAGAPKKAEG